MAYDEKAFKVINNLKFSAISFRLSDSESRL